MNTDIKNFIEESRPSFIKFGRHFLSKLEDEELVTTLTERDSEKLSRVFRALLEIYSQSSGDEQPEALSAIINAFGAIDKGGDETE